MWFSTRAPGMGEQLLKGPLPCVFWEMAHHLETLARSARELGIAARKVSLCVVDFDVAHLPLKVNFMGNLYKSKIELELECVGCYLCDPSLLNTSRGKSSLYSLGLARTQPSSFHVRYCPWEWSSLSVSIHPLPSEGKAKTLGGGRNLASQPSDGILPNLSPNVHTSS